MSAHTKPTGAQTNMDVKDVIKSFALSLRSFAVIGVAPRVAVTCLRIPASGGDSLALASSQPHKHTQSCTHE